MKKITFLNLHLGFGGIETATINSANALSKYYEIEIISFYNLKNNQAYKLNDNIKVKYLYNGEPNKEKIKKSIKKFKIISFIKNAFRAMNILYLKRKLIIQEIINCRSNVIVSTRYEFSKYLSEYGNKNVIKIAEEHQHHNNNEKYINIIKNKYNNIDYLFALTSSLANDYKEFLIDNKHTKVAIIPNMLVTYPSKLSNLSNNIISVGRLHALKRINELIEIFSKIEDKTAKLFIIGSGNESESLKELIIKLNLEERVLLLGNMTHEQIKPYMLNSALFAMTSTTEALPMVLLEAMSYGVPAIAYETSSGTNDIIDDSCGYIIKNRNEKKYIDTINNYLKLENKTILSNNAVEKSRKFSDKEIIKKWIEIIEQK